MLFGRKRSHSAAAPEATGDWLTWKRLFPEKARWWEWHGTVAGNDSVPPSLYVMGACGNTTCIQPEKLAAATKHERY